MEVIEYRGWFEGSETLEAAYIYGLVTEHSETRSVIAGDGVRRAVVPDSVTQFTGAKDKTQNKIFGGDIIVCKAYPFFGDAVHKPQTFNQLNYVGVVEYCSVNFGWYIDLVTVSDRVRGDVLGDGLAEYAEYCTVIGNKFKNPELLEISSNYLEKLKSCIA